MSQPNIFEKKPAVLNLDPGKYFWCSCGQSNGQPFCDGSHKGTDFTPVAFELSQPKKAALCNCKMTNNKPYCDGTHSKI